MIKINYIKNDSNNTIINPFLVINDKRAIYYIKELCMAHLFTLEGYFKTVKKNLFIKQKIPIYLNSKTILFYNNGFMDYDSIFINYLEIKEIKQMKDNLIIIFRDNEQLKVDFSYYEYLSHVKRVKKILNYKNKYL